MGISEFLFNYFKRFRTHVASIIGGVRSGVAKNIKLIPLRACSPSDCQLDHVMNALEHVETQWTQWKQDNPNDAAIVNFSGLLKNSRYDGILEQVNALRKLKITVIVASENDENRFDCNTVENQRSFTDLKATEMLTNKIGVFDQIIRVGASNYKDRSEESSFGNCVDLFAPGKNQLISNN